MSAENKQILQALLENSAILTETTQPFSLYPYPPLSECLRVFMFYSRPPYDKQWLSSYHDAALRYSEGIMTHSFASHRQKYWVTFTKPEGLQVSSPPPPPPREWKYIYIYCNGLLRWSWTVFQSLNFCMSRIRLKIHLLTIKTHKENQQCLSNILKRGK